MSQDETLFERGRVLLTQAYRQLPVMLLQADMSLNPRQLMAAHASTMQQLLQQGQEIFALLFLLATPAEEGQPFERVVPQLPTSLSSGEVRRIIWRARPIALSVHHDPLPAELVYSQQLSAVLAWSIQHRRYDAGLVVSEEARMHTQITDPLPLSAFTMAAGSEQREEESGL